LGGSFGASDFFWAWLTMLISSMNAKKTFLMT
jgi:hypothetical protein